ncbi:DUF2897 family protein [Aliidiomarina indica]|uniref:DUF2897 family protein n=1 Tax=Aliidiomarina indica TaxID=2749147 RepID=UPI00188FC63D|nr:DUF2897 family protein [Aliidiomarina indica]
MSIWGIIIIVLAIGIILSNIMLVKKTANMKMPESVLKKAEQQKLLEQQEKDKEKSARENRSSNQDEP